ncbi:MAG: selenoneine biosynthesis selenosugar synthase SenB [Burkholderiales bacterium]
MAFIVTPGTREANNGNWRTAKRWAGFLAGVARPIVQSEWDGEPADVAIALHAKRSAASIERLKARRPATPLALVLSGTDLYRDLPKSAEARRSLELADRIVALQDDALAHVPREHLGKCEVIFQSSTPLAAARKPRGRLDIVAVGHLRGEKDPRTLWEALRLLDPRLPVRIRHIGAALDPVLGREARRLMARDPRYRWRGALPHGLARCAIRDAHLLVHPSIMEGGANVIVEAITAGTPVLASRISGNIGMLGGNYPGYFEVGDAAGLARGIERLLERPAALRELREACARRRPLFSPARERQALRRLFLSLLRKDRR